ncbi:hypothetical protein [Clostridium tarantellae]|uniref:YcxB family protein n=1 Tax=Clostridium tarantellae TaxID=39493 RepID=A0A6I1MIF1_9CLOT|nr:hypothetical protein [Clostridium tarantellae]MPQ42188.1 hypothetical protein [Clostridium tarantellae]
MLCFNLTKELYKKCRVKYINYELRYQVLLEFIGCILVIIMTRLFLVNNKNFSDILYIITLGGWGVFSLYCNIKNKKILLKKIEKDIKLFEELNMFGQCSVELLNEGLNVKYNSKTKIYPWNIIKNALIINNDLYITISSVEHIIISQKAFNKDKSSKDFIKDLEEYKKFKTYLSIIQSI